MNQTGKKLSKISQIGEISSNLVTLLPGDVTYFAPTAFSFNDDPDKTSKYKLEQSFFN